MNSCPREQSANRPRRIQIEHRGADRRLRPLSRQAHGGRRRRRLGRHLPRRPRGPARRRALARPRRDGLARGADAPRRRRATRACAGRARSPSTSPAAGRSRSRRGPTRSRRGARSSTARSPRAIDDLSGELSEGVLLLERVAGLAEGADRVTLERALSVVRDATAPTRTRAEAALGARAAATPRSARPTGWSRRSCRSRSSSTSIASGPGSAPGTSCSRAPGAASRACAERLPRAGRARLRRPLPAADPPDRPHEPQGRATTPSSPAPAIPAARGRSATRPAATTPIHPDLGTIDDFDALVAEGRRSTASRSRSTSRSSARPTTRGSPTTPSGSTAGPTAR